MRGGLVDTVHNLPRRVSWMLCARVRAGCAWRSSTSCLPAESAMTVPRSHGVERVAEVDFLRSGKVADAAPRPPRQRRWGRACLRPLRGPTAGTRPRVAPTQVRILILGLDNAGKTTVLYRLQVDEPVTTCVPRLRENGARSRLERQNACRRAPSRRCLPWSSAPPPNPLTCHPVYRPLSLPACSSVPTIGFNVETLDYKGIKFQVRGGVRVPCPAPVARRPRTSTCHPPPTGLSSDRNSAGISAGSVSWSAGVSGR